MDEPDRSELGLFHYLKEYNHGPNSRMSITFNSSKGLLNAPGQNNCFLNSAVQVLWHLDAFRRSFRMLSGHSCMGNACIFCALKVMFTQFQYSDKSVLPPDALRSAMAETFANQQRFQLGYMDDAAECFENILMRLHLHISPEDKEDSCTAPHCIPHQKFTMSVTEQVVCPCGAKSEPFTFNEMVFYVSTGALVNEAKAEHISSHPSGSFSQLLKNTVAKGDTRGCPNNCGRTAEKRRNLINCPDVVSIGLVWESAKSGSQHIKDVVGRIGTTLNLQELFHTTNDVRCEKQGELHLVGVVCYYGKHYSTFFFHSKVHEWIYFDDAAVKQISSDWSRVCEKLCKGKHQPLLLLYMNPNTSSVSLDRAPKFSSMAPGYEWKDVNGVCHEAPNQHQRQRSLTPGPEIHQHDVDIIPRRAVTPGPDLRNIDMSKLAEDELDYPYFKGGSHQYSRLSPPRQTGKRPERQYSQISSLTCHSSDSHSSSSSGEPMLTGHMEVNRQMSENGSYSSRASTMSSNTCSSTVDSDALCYTLSNKDHIRRPSIGDESALKVPNNKEKRKEKPKISLKQRKNKQRFGADVVRYQSISSLPTQSSYDDSSLERKESMYDMPVSSDSNPGYATLPRKKKNLVAHTSSSETEKHLSWMKDVANKDETLQHETQSASISERIQMFNGLNDETTSKSKPLPEIKPILLNTVQNDSNGEPSYIRRSNVEKILNQQRKAAKTNPTAVKILRPTHDQFNLPEEYLSSSDSNKSGFKFDHPDNSSIGSLKDSGYRSGCDRTSNSASSISSMSIESPTTNQSFTFDKEPLYCEPPPPEQYQFSSLVQPDIPVKNYQHQRQQKSEDFSFPPPPSDLELNHTKQLSEASLLSEASTVKHRKSPSAEIADSSNKILADSIGKMALSGKENNHYQMVGQAEDFRLKSVERETTGDLSTAQRLCHQAISLLSSVLSEGPSHSDLLEIAHRKHEILLARSKALHLKITREKEKDVIQMKPNDYSNNQIKKKTMGELHINNQVKREAASNDYTPISSACNRAPVCQSDAKPNLAPKSLTAPDCVPTKQCNRYSNHDRIQPIPQNNSSVSLDKYMPIISNNHRMPTRTVLERQTSSGSINSNSSSQSQGKANHVPANRHNLYAEVKIPIRNELSKGEAVDNQKQEEPITNGLPAEFIPPPKEFQAPSPTAARVGNSYIYTQSDNHAYPKANSTSSYNRLLQPTVGQPTSNLPTRSNQYQHCARQAQPTYDIYKEVPLPPKTGNSSMSKKGIRDLLVQDMLKRTGQNPPLPSSQQSQHNSSQHNYDRLLETPMWTPPQQSAYDRGVSHYDRPTHLGKNQYGKINSITNQSNGPPNGYHDSRQQYNHNYHRLPNGYPGPINGYSGSINSENYYGGKHHSRQYSTEL